MVNHSRITDDNPVRAPSSRLSVAFRAISRSVRGPRRSNDYMVLSVPVRPVGDDGDTVPDNDEQSRFDSLLQMQQRLKRNVVQIRNQKNRLYHRIVALNQYFVSMEANIRSIAQYSVCVEMNIRTILRCFNS